jgi:hypothetical protein
MKMKARRLNDSEVAERTLQSGPEIWYVHSTGRLLDRIEVATTTQITASQGPEGCVVASRIEPKLDGDRSYPNQWRAIARRDGREEPGQTLPYGGGASIVRMTPLKTVPGALLVEAHFAFEEPKAWFDGAPILRSKFSLIALDRIRALRRELARPPSR